MKIDEEDETDQMRSQEKDEHVEPEEFKVGDEQLPNSMDELFISKQESNGIDETSFNQIENNIKSSSSTSSFDSFEKRTLKEEIDLHLEMSHLTLGELKEDDLKLNEKKSSIFINNQTKIDDEASKYNKQQAESKINDYTYFYEKEPSYEHRLALANIKLADFNSDFYDHANTANYKNTRSEHLHKPKALLENLLGCIKPFLGYWFKPNANEDSNGNLKELTENYEIPFESLRNLEWIDSGSEGSVFKGQFHNEIVAIKKVKSRADTQIAHLLRLNHKNLVKFKGVSFDRPDFLCIVMEFCPFGSLYAHINQKGSCIITPSRFMRYARNIAEGMEYLHANGLIHRDLKSPNLLITLFDMLKISDFGSTKSMNEKVATEISFRGTVAWMAPEIIRQSSCTEKVDSYSYGVVLWEILTCQVPFKNLTTNAIMYGIGNGSLRLPIPKTVPQGIRFLLKICLNKTKPRNRPSFSQILKHLEVIETNESMLKNEDEYVRFHLKWQEEVKQQDYKQIEKENFYQAADFYQFNEDLIEKRREELAHAIEIRDIYEKKLEKVTNMYYELNTVLLKLEDREKAIMKREQELNIQEKSVVQPILKREFRNSGQSYMLRGNMLSKPLSNNHSSNEYSNQANHSQLNLRPRSVLINQTGNEIDGRNNRSKNQLNLSRNETRNGFANQQTNVEATTPSTPLTLSPSLALQRKTLRSKSASSIDVLMLQWDKLKNEKLTDYLEPSETNSNSKQQEEMLKNDQKLSRLSPRDYLAVEQASKSSKTQLKSRSLSDKTIYFY